MTVNVAELVGQRAVLDAVGFCRAFRAASLLTSSDEARPALAGVHVEVYEDLGARMIGTDSFALVVTWAPWEGQADVRRTREPDIGESPDWAATIVDNHGVLGKVAAIVQKNANEILKAGLEPPPVELSIIDKPALLQGTFDGLSPVVAELSYSAVIDAAAVVYEGDYPTWRAVVGPPPKARKTAAVQLAAGLLGKVCSAAQIMGEHIRWDLAGSNAALRFIVDPVESDDDDPFAARRRSRAGCYGVLMPEYMSEQLNVQA